MVPLKQYCYVLQRSRAILMRPQVYETLVMGDHWLITLDLPRLFKHSEHKSHRNGQSPNLISPCARSATRRIIENPNGLTLPPLSALPDIGGGSRSLSRNWAFRKTPESEIIRHRSRICRRVAKRAILSMRTQSPWTRPGRTGIFKSSTHNNIATMRIYIWHKRTIERIAKFQP